MMTRLLQEIYLKYRAAVTKGLTPICFYLDTHTYHRLAQESMQYDMTQHLTTVSGERHVMGLPIVEVINKSNYIEVGVDI